MVIRGNVTTTFTHAYIKSNIFYFEYCSITYYVVYMYEHEQACEISFLNMLD